MNKDNVAVAVIILALILILAWLPGALDRLSQQLEINDREW